MAYSSNRSVALCISKALFQHRRGAFYAATATALYRLHVGSREERNMTGFGGAAKSTTEVAYDATKGRVEKVKDTVIAVADANENVVDTTGYRSMEDMGTVKTCSF